jgi:CO/xanthine dehydrogenase FAD-binding subunit
MQMTDAPPLWLRPTSPEAAVAAMLGGARALAGGTDLYPAAGRELGGAVVDLTAIPALAGLSCDGAGGVRIGACTPWAALARPGALPAGLAALAQAARQVGGRQVQVAGTIGGNLCNASPAADGVPPLLACDAVVEILGPGGARSLPLAAFLLGPRRTALMPAEIVTAVHLPAAGLAGRSRFAKLGARAHLVISIAMVAVRLVLDGRGRIVGAAVAVGACGPVATRMPEVEAAALGLTPHEAAAQVDPRAVAAALAPRDDVRATAAYRRQAAATLIARAMEELG